MVAGLPAADKGSGDFFVCSFFCCRGKSCRLGGQPADSAGFIIGPVSFVIGAANFVIGPAGFVIHPRMPKPGA